MKNDYSLEELQGHGLNVLDVYVNETKAATLVKEGNRYILTYLPDVSPELFVSLTMPVRAESWVSTGRLHPFFEINLPEGARKELLASAFGKAMVTEEMSILALTGNDTIGRVRVVPSGFPLDWKSCPSFDVRQAIQEDSAVFFGRMIEKYAAQGVSGVQPKLLLTPPRITLKESRWIAKYDGDTLDGLSINEFLSMKAAKASGLDVPTCVLSKDGRSIFVERFDMGSGFEDFCSLLALSPLEKYQGSYEKINKIIASFVSDRLHFREQLIKSHIFNVCIGNADAHLKNFGLLYSTGEIPRLAPFFDLVTVRAFEDFKKDIPALSIGGKKEWVVGKIVERLATDWGINRSKVEEFKREISAGVKGVLPDIKEMTERHPWFREQGKQMAAVWDTGIQRIYGEK